MVRFLFDSTTIFSFERDVYAKPTILFGTIRRARLTNLAAAQALKVSRWPYAPYAASGRTVDAGADVCDDPGEPRGHAPKGLGEFVRARRADPEVRQPLQVGHLTRRNDPRKKKFCRPESRPALLALIKYRHTAVPARLKEARKCLR
jgi:hypothetical protein